jgi:hypothetical protein
MSYAALVCKSNFSFLEGASHPMSWWKRPTDLKLTTTKSI